MPAGRRDDAGVVAILVAGSDARVAVTEDGTISHVNAPAGALLGYSPDELIGHIVEDLLPAQFVAGHIRARADFGADPHYRALGEGPDLRVRRRDGSEFPARISLTPIDTADGRNVVATILDVTVRTALEVALAAGERRYRTVLEAAPYPVLAVDPAGLIMFANPLVGITFGYPPDALLGRSVQMLLPEDRTAGHVGQMARFFAELQPRPMGVGMDMVGRRRDGSSVPIEIALVPVQTADGPLVFAAIVDITRRKAIEAQLLQAQKMESVGRLAGGVAHDMNNYLGAIRGFADLLLEDLGMPGAAGHEPLIARASAIRDAADRAAALTYQLLAFARQQVLTPRILDIADAVSGLEPMLRRLIGEDVDLVLQREPGPLRVRADASQLDQILVNLVVNARDAMPMGGTVRVETRRGVYDDADAARHFGVQPGSYATIIVSDTGVGMSEEVRQHAFDPFFTTKELGAGTGLGLPIIHGVVNQSGGHVWLYSEPGRGTTVKVLLPEVRGEVEPAGGAVPEPPRSRGGRALVVEDAEVVRDYTTQLLQRAGFAVTAVSNAAAALEVLGTLGDPVDVLVSDVVMPGMSGIVLARRVRALFPGVAIVLVSGYTEGALDLDATLARGAAFVGKPFTRIELLDAVTAALATRHEA